MRQWTTLHKYMWLRILQGANAVYKTVKGAVISFVTKKAAPLKELKVEFNPVQDLHGYDSPWPAGGGKNLLDKSTASGTTTVWFMEPNGVLFKAGTTYCFSIGTAGEVASLAIYGTDKTTQLAYASSGLTQAVTFTPESDVYGLPRMYKGGSVPQTAIDSAMLEIGSVRTTYSPYSNICPISGWTKAEVAVWDSMTPCTIASVTYNADTRKCSFIVEDGIPGGYVGIKGGLLAAPGINFDPSTDELTYEEASTHTSDPNGAWFVKESSALPGVTGTWINYTWNKSSVSLGDVWYIRPFVFVTDPNGDEQKWYGETKSFTAGIDYTNPINPAKWTASISLGETVYSGTVDVLTGVATVDKGSFTVSQATPSSFAVGSAGAKYSFKNLPVIGKMVPSGNSVRLSNPMSSALSTCATSYYQTIARIEGSGYITKNIYSFYNDAANFLIYLVGTDWTEETFLAAVNDWRFCFDLATPQTIQLTPKEVSTLLGENTIWSSANGDLTVTYRSN